jgi:hypothetical protein
LTDTRCAGVKISIGPAAAVSARSRSVRPSTEAERTSDVPRTSTGPSRVSIRQNGATEEWVPAAAVPGAARRR